MVVLRFLPVVRFGNDAVAHRTGPLRPWRLPLFCHGTKPCVVLGVGMVAYESAERIVPRRWLIEEGSRELRQDAALDRCNAPVIDQRSGTQLGNAVLVIGGRDDA